MTHQFEQHSQYFTVFVWKNTPYKRTCGNETGTNGAQSCRAVRGLEARLQRHRASTLARSEEVAFVLHARLEVQPFVAKAPVCHARATGPGASRDVDAHGRLAGEGGGLRYDNI